MNETTQTATTANSPIALLELPAVERLSQDQVRGITCVWDGIALAPDTVVDLGPRTMNRLGDKVQWFPRACGRCVAAQALRALFDHAEDCALCQSETTMNDCAPGHGLRRLISGRGQR